MADEQRSYSLEELARRSGIDSETIRRWREQNLIPSPGRQDDQTRYPRETLDRLLFLSRVMQCVDEGEIPPMSAEKLATALDQLDHQDIVTANQAKLPAERLAAMLMIPQAAGGEDSTASSQRRAGAFRQRFSGGRSGPGRGIGPQTEGFDGLSA